MTDQVMSGSADLPLAERRRIQAEQEQAHRDGIRRRHFDVTQGQRQIDAAILADQHRQARIGCALLGIGHSRKD